MLVHEMNTPYTREEIVEIVKMIRLHLYNNGLHCGARVIREDMEDENVQPLPYFKHYWAYLVTPWLNTWQNRIL